MLTDLVVVFTVIVVVVGVGISVWSIVGTRKMKQSSNPIFLRESVSSGFPMPEVNPPREHCKIIVEGFSIEPVNPDRFKFSDFQKTISRLSGVLSVMGISTIYNPVVSFPQYTFCKRSTGKEFVYQVNTHQEPVWMLSIVSDGLNDLLSSD